MLARSLVNKARHLAGLLVCCTFFPHVSHAHTDLTFVDWGGDLARAHMQAWVLPWEKANDKQARLEYYSGGIAEIEEQVDTTNVRWDVVDMEYSDLIRACDNGLLEKVDHSSLPDASDDFMEGALANECGVGVYVWSTVFAYDMSLFSADPPDTIADFFDVASYPGGRGLRNDPRGTLEWALMSAGVPATEVYATLSTDDGLDQAFAELDKLKPYIVWWSGGGEPVQLLKDGTVSMTAAWNGRLYRSIVEEDAPIGIGWDGQVWEIEYLAILKGSRNLDNAKDFLSFASSPEGMADVAKYVPYGPVRKSARERVVAEVKPYLPTENMGDSSLRFDSPWWAENIVRIRQRFDDWVAPSGGDVEGRGARF